MDLLTIAAVLACSLLFITAGLALLLYVVPIRSRIRIRVAETGTAVTVITASWLVFGIRITQEAPKGSVAILLAERVVFTLPLRRQKESSPVIREERPEEEPNPVQLLRPGILASITRRLAAPLASLGSTIWQESRFEGITGRVTLGLGDPVLTGEFYGYYWACRFLLEAFRIRIDMDPDFNRDVFSCDLETSLCLAHPLLVIIAAVKLALHPAIRETASLFTARAPGGTGA